MRRGDVIARVDGRRIKTALQLIEMLEPMTAGQAIEMELVRAGELLHAQPRAEELPQSRVAAILKSRLGLTLRQRSADDAYEIVEVDPDSAARALGLRRGDALLAINGVTLGSHEDLRKAVARLRGLGRALVVVQRGPGRYHLTLPLL